MTGPVRILRVIARMNVGGPALQISGLQRRLDRSLFDSRLVAGSVDDGEADYLALRASDVDATVIPGLGRSVRPLGDLRAWARLLEEIRTFRPHIVHTHTAKAGVLGRTAARVANVPYTVHTFHGHLLHGYFSPRTSRAMARLEGSLARRTSRLVAVGGHVRDDLVQAGIGSPEQYVVVPPGVELPPPPERSIARTRLGLSTRGLVVGFTARLTAVKRPDRLLQVARIVLETVPDVTFIVAGDGPELAGLRVAAADLGDRVRFLGWRPDVEVVHAATDVALLTSDNEGMPVSLIEAHMCGTPAVATDVGSVDEVVLNGRTGLVVPPHVRNLADATLSLLSDADVRLRMGVAAAQHARSQFSLERLVSDTETLYHSLVDPKP